MTLALELLEQLPASRWSYGPWCSLTLALAAADLSPAAVSWGLSSCWSEFVATAGLVTVAGSDNFNSVVNSVPSMT